MKIHTSKLQQTAYAETEEREKIFSRIADSGTPITLEGASLLTVSNKYDFCHKFIKFDLNHDDLVEVISRVHKLQPIIPDTDIFDMLTSDDFSYEVYCSYYTDNSRVDSRLRFAALEQGYDEQIPLKDSEIVLITETVKTFAEKEDFTKNEVTDNHSL